MNEIIQCLLSIATIGISSLASVIAARIAAKKEIRKMMLSWQREDMVSSEREFSEMCAAVTQYVVDGNNSNWKNALEKISALRARHSGGAGEHLDVLYYCVHENNQNGADKELSLLIDAKRAQELDKPSKHKRQKRR